MSSCSDRISHEVVKHTEVGVPSIQDGRRLTEPYGFGRGMTSELVADPTPGDYDAGLSVSAQKDAQSTGVKMELARVAPA